MRVRSSVFVLVLAFASLSVAADVLTVPVGLRPGVTADVSVNVIENPDPHPKGLDVLIVHGLAQTGATFVPLANALFDERMGHRVGRVLIVDLPGHGNSALPDGLLFEQLVIEDYATAVLGVLQQTGADVVIGHSMGAAVVQAAQHRLVGSDTSLRASFGVDGVVLLAPVIPAPLPWSFVDSGAAFAILSDPALGLITFDPARGIIVDFPPPIWVNIFHSNRAGAVPAGAPSPADAAANGYISPEAYFASLQTIRLAPITFDSDGIFAAEHGTAAGVVSLGNDTLFTAEEHQALYLDLTGDFESKLFFVVDGADAVHNMHLVRPEALAHPIKKVMNAIPRVD